MVDNDGIEHAGYLAFLELLALFPFLVLIVALSGFIGQSEVGVRFIEILFQVIPPEAADSLQPRITEIVSGPPQGLLTVSILGAIWTASSAVEGIRTTLNRAFQVTTPPNYWLRRALSIAQLLFFTFVIMLVTITMVFAPIVIDHFERMAHIDFDYSTEVIANKYFFIISGIILFLIVSNVYYILPNIKQRWRAVMPGALLVAVGWLGGAYVFSMYIQNVEQVNIIYGSLGGFIATLLFFFIMNIIFIYGAEFNYLLTTRVFGERIEEKEHYEEPEEDEKSSTS